MTGRPGELGIDRVRSGGRDQVVIGVSGPVVRLAGTGGEVVTVSVSGLLAGEDFAVLDSRPPDRTRSPMPSSPGRPVTGHRPEPRPRRQGSPRSA